jgi:hypothetical protein
MNSKTIAYFYNFNIVIMLFNLQTIGDSFIVKIITPVLLIVSCIISFSFNKKNSESSKSEKINFFLQLSLIIFLLGVLRNNHPESTLKFTIFTISMQVSFLILTYNTIKYFISSQHNAIDILYNLLFLPFLFFSTLNLLLFFLDFNIGSSQDISIGNAVILSNFGIYTQRIKFPFADGFNSFSMVNSIVFYFSLYFLFIEFRKVLISMLGVFVFGAIILYTDSRSALIYPILVTIIIFFFLKLKSILKIQLFYIIPFVYLLGPLLLFWIVTFIGESGVTDDYSRKAEEAQTGNGRFIIWAFSMVELVNFKLQSIFGYGIYGHYASGASLNWAFMFPSYNNPEIIHPHNSMISMLFDYGLIGVLAYFFQLFSQINKLLKYALTSYKGSLFLIGAITLFILLGLSESIYGIYYSGLSILLFFTYILIDQIRISNEHKQIPSN